MNLCPCMSTQKGVKIVAIIDAILCTLNFGLYVLTLPKLIQFLMSDDELVVELTTRHKATAIGGIALGMIRCILVVLLAVKLFHGAIKRDHESCRFWVFARAVIVIITIIFFVLNTIVGEFNGILFGINGVIILYVIYGILVVHSFTKTITQARDPKA